MSLPTSPHVEAAEQAVMRVVEDHYLLYRQELEEFNRNHPTPHIGIVAEAQRFLNRLYAWEMTFWGYDSVRFALRYGNDSPENGPLAIGPVLMKGWSAPY